MARKKIHFAMIEAGGGHRTPALAVYEALAELFPGKYEMRVLDFMKELGCEDLDAAHKKLWKYLLARPELTKSIQTFDFITGPVNIQIYKLAGDRFVKHVMRYLYNEKPDLIFSTHYFNTMGIARIRKRYNIGPILINYLTEVFDFDSYWYLKNVDHYIVTSEQARQKLLRGRIPAEKLQVFPYPVRHSFFRIGRSREEILGSLGLDVERKTMLITLGSEGIGPLHKMIAALVRREFPLSVVVVAGRNEALREQIQQDFGGGRGPTRVVAVSYTERLNELLWASDFCFIKPGPATTWEAMSLKKPIIFYQSAQLSENPNIRHVVQNGFGFYAGEVPRRLVRVVANFLEGSALEQCRAAYERTRLENGADAIARFVDSVLESAGG
jgi:UDP-N-acetylglucosamine:LPS N-acetylglucosamine transferase